MGSPDDQVHTVAVDATGPYGPIEPLVYEINLADFCDSLDQPAGSLHRVRSAIDDLSKRFPKSGPLKAEVINRNE